MSEEFKITVYSFLVVATALIAGICLSDYYLFMKWMMIIIGSVLTATAGGKLVALGLGEFMEAMDWFERIMDPPIPLVFVLLYGPMPSRAQRAMWRCFTALKVLGLGFVTFLAIMIAFKVPESTTTGAVGASFFLVGFALFGAVTGFQEV